MQKIVIIGGGAGGLELASSLGQKLGRKNKAEITLIDKSLTHVWKPLFHEIAAGTLNNLADEVNYFSHAQANHYGFQLGELVNVNHKEKSILIRNPLSKTASQELVLNYDVLVLAFGGISNNFNTPGANKYCYYLDSLAEAEKVHQHLLDGFINAQFVDNDNEFKVAVIGGGATGVEFAAELQNAAKVLTKIHKGKHISQTKIQIIEASDRLLSMLPERVSKLTDEKLIQLGVEVKTNHRVKEIKANGILIADNTFIHADLIIWAAGVKGAHFVKDLGDFELTASGLIKVNSSLQTTTYKSIFAIGDCAACEQEDGSLVPARAQAAHQQAEFLKKMIPLYLSHKSLGKYDYVDKGSLVALSEAKTVGLLMGKLHKSLLIEGWFARMAYLLLYKLHQVKLFGWYQVVMLTVGNFLTKKVRVRLKLH
jgi:NADH dehydrogenase